MREWSFQAIDAVDKLKHLDRPMIAEVFSYDEFDRDNGRFEYIYGVDLSVDVGEAIYESVKQFLLDDQLAIEVGFFFLCVAVCVCYLNLYVQVTLWLFILYIALQKGHLFILDVFSNKKAKCV